MYVIYSKEGCGYCRKAKDFLDSKKLEFKEIVLDPTSEDYVVVRDGLVGRTGHRTFPWIFEGDRFVGGYGELICDVELEEF